MKRQILTIISLILTIGMILPTANAEETSTYSDYVVEGQSTYADSFGLMKGYDDGTFKPDNNMTRADLYGGYPHAYMSLGYYNRFFKSSTDNRNGNIEMNETKEKTAITRRDAMDMLGGMIFTPICVVTDYKTAFDGSNEPIYEIGGNGTVKQTLFTIKNAK